MAESQEKKVINEVYRRLFAWMGPRHWWPAETVFEVIVGTILTQNVAWRNVEKAIANLKAASLLELTKLADYPREELEELIRCTRYYKQKAKRLQDFCRYVTDRHQGCLDLFLRGETDALRGELLSLPGIGQETADCILVYAAGKPSFVIDAYTKRIFSRLGLTREDISYRELQQRIHTALPRDAALYNEYHALLDGLGNRVCLAQNPRCAVCPLASLCAYPPRTKESPA